MISALRELAESQGLAWQWRDFQNRAREVSDDTLRDILSALDFACATPAQIDADLAATREQQRHRLPPMLTATQHETLRLSLPATRYELVLESGERLHGAIENGALPPVAHCGYHRLTLDVLAPVQLAVAPPRCFGLSDLDAPPRKRWGLSAQVPSLRRAGDGGIGDFGGVAALAGVIAPRGADALAISPAHALFHALPAHHAPYSPSTRLARNAMLADPAAALGQAAVQRALAQTGLAATFAELEARPLIAPERSARAKRELFGALFAQLDGAALHTFTRFAQNAAPALRLHARFEALHAHFSALGQDDWREWPQVFRDPQSPAVDAFAREHARTVDYHLFLQWLAECSLVQAQQSARDAGMAVGLIGDLAVGTQISGSHAWSRQGELFTGLSVGAPPDLLNTRGQDWGLSAFSPRALVQNGYAAFIELLRASFAHVGGVRLDHVFGLQRLWLIPPGASADCGAYLHYPIADLMRLVALESWRHRAIVVGEDLGTIPDGFQPYLANAGLLGMRVLWFEREHGYFSEPGRWSRKAVAMTTTHDLPTVAGWWQGRDLAWRTQLALLAPDQTSESLAVERAQERHALWNAFAHAGVAQGAQPAADAPGSAAVVEAACVFIGRTPCELALLPLEDALALSEQPNIPGTTQGHPNWCRRLECEVADLHTDEALRTRLQTLDAARCACG